MSLIAENKSAVTQTLLDQLQNNASKVAFMPDSEIVSAIRYLEDKGIPNNKHEDYKYCNIEGILRKEFKSVEQSFNALIPEDIAPLKLEEAINLVVVNGNYVSALSEKMIVRGLTVKAFNELSALEKNLLSSQAKSESDALIALNSAFCGNGLYLEIENANVIPMPIHIIYVNSGNGNCVVNTRSFIRIGPNAEATLVESFYNIGNSKVFSNFVSEKLVEENAKLTCFTFQNEGSLSYSVHTNQAKIFKYGNYSNMTATLSGELVRNNHNVVLAEPNCEAHLNGLFITQGTQQVDNHTLIDHQMPNCESNELYKGIAKDKSSGTFNGKIFVRKDAQKTNAYQSSKNILMSDDATINTKPQLEIYADDVKCSHGTSTGKIDTEALFYLKARGIGEDTARKLLLQAFAQELIDKIEIPTLQERVLHLFEESL
ncbi:MAG: Fe-S cluster assembly protein SufD [Bacteroidota bacterium]|jgi:Fe-S cluster assembly protein SufD|nr:Fe-S cluster assembly protein SufD [Bacteroidota bacterium]